MSRTVHARTLHDLCRRCRAGALPALVLLAAGGLMSGCIPDRLVLNLTAADRELRESAVLADSRPEGKVALIHVGGFLVDARVPGLLSAGQSPVDELVARLELAEADPGVRAVVMRVNSPGGTVTGSAVMAREIRRFAERTGKPVVASMGEIAASGGFYVSLAADRIYAEPTTITGSIGVIIQTFNLSGGMEMVGIRGKALTSGPNKDLANPFQKEREEQFAVLQEMVDDFYDGFRNQVVTRRPAFNSDAHARLLDGRVLTGADAFECGLVDSIGGMREAFEEAKRLTGLQRASLVTYHDDATTARTPYASSAPFATEGANEREFNLVQINAGSLLSGAQGGAGFYYLWAPPTP